MAKLGLKAVKSYYRANKHNVGDPTIMWPQRMKLTSTLRAFLVISDDIYTFCIIVLEERKKKRIMKN